MIFQKNEYILIFWNRLRFYGIIFKKNRVCVMIEIERKDYLNKLIRCANTPDIKVITGVRRSGKSYLLNHYIGYVKTNEVNTNIIFINLQDLDNEKLRTYKSLHNYIKSRYIAKRRNLVLVDEIQLCEKFEWAINSLHSKHMFDIYITGSNAFLLSNDLATLFTGRTINIEVLPFSYKEYVQFHKLNNLDYSFEGYTTNGGLSGSYLYSEDGDKYSYIKDVYSTIITRDLVQKYKIRNSADLQSIANFMLDNISNLLSVDSITKNINEAGGKITNKTVKNYITYLENAFLYYKAARYDVKGKKHLKTNHKFYASDTGFKYAILGKKNMDYGYVYENIVYLELLRRGFEVYTGKLYKKEVDFVALKQNEKIYIKVSDNISNSKTLKRELLPLQSIYDAYPKFLIANTGHPDYDIEGINICNLENWLLS